LIGNVACTKHTIKIVLQSGTGVAKQEPAKNCVTYSLCLGGWEIFSSNIEKNFIFKIEQKSCSYFI